MESYLSQEKFKGHGPMADVADVTLVVPPSSNLKTWSGSDTLLEVGLYLCPNFIIFSIIMLQGLLVRIQLHRAIVVKVVHRLSKLMYIAIDGGLEFFDGRRHPRDNLERQETTAFVPFQLP